MKKQYAGWLFAAVVVIVISTIFYQFQPAGTPVEKAFHVDVTVLDSKTLRADWQIMPGYQLYKDRIEIEAETPARLGAVLLPEGKVQKDTLLGEYEVYEKPFSVMIPVTEAGKGVLKLHVAYQGCREKTYCYPPVSKTFTLNMDSRGSNAFLSWFFDQTFLLTLLGFFGMGLLLAFTPCVLPMIPVLAGMIVGQKDKLTGRRAFLLSLSYVLSMAVTYAAAGAAAAYLGATLQSLVQNTIVVNVFGAILVVLALPLFGLFELKMPAVLQNRWIGFGGKQRKGTYAGAVLMGCASTLVLSPCVTPPLIGALSYMSLSGNVLTGGAALFVMALGMGIPLLILGALGGRFLPQSGVWMMGVRYFSGLILLAAAAWLFSQGIFRLSSEKEAAHEPSISSLMDKPSSVFTPVYNLTELHIKLKEAIQRGQPVILDFYADWCIACIKMEHLVFRNAEVKQALSHFLLLRADVTQNDTAARALQKAYGVFAPPTIVFLIPDDQHSMKEIRLDGEVGAEIFLDHVQIAMSQWKTERK